MNTEAGNSIGGNAVAAADQSSTLVALDLALARLQEGWLLALLLLWVLWEVQPLLSLHTTCG